jgi:tetratricopeptide (TPR) repeat protein
MDFAEQLRVLQDAEGDPARLALATVDLAYPELPEAERTALREALEAAAIPHWCDEAILAALLEMPLEAATARMTKLRGLKVVEEFRARGLGAANGHEAARLALRKALFTRQPERFRALSARAAAHCAGDESPIGRIEWIYHRLSADPERGAAELARIDREWSPVAHPEDRSALGVALQELEDSGLVAGRARAWVLLTVGWVRYSRGETVQLMPAAREALNVAQAARDEAAEADARCLIGDALEAQGRLAEAQVAYGEDLAISRRLAAQDPSNADWQWDLAVTCEKLALLHRKGGRAPEELLLWEEASQILERLVRIAPYHVEWQQAQRRYARELERTRMLVSAQPSTPSLGHPPTAEA